MSNEIQTVLCLVLLVVLLLAWMILPRLLANWLRRTHAEQKRLSQQQGQHTRAYQVLETLRVVARGAGVLSLAVLVSGFGQCAGWHAFDNFWQAMGVLGVLIAIVCAARVFAVLSRPPEPPAAPPRPVAPTRKNPPRT